MQLNIFLSYNSPLHSKYLDLNNAWAVVTDNASYRLKAHKEVLKGVMPYSVHVTGLCHVVNLVGETWQYYKHFSEVVSLVTLLRSVPLGELPYYQEVSAGQGSSYSSELKLEKLV